MYASVLHTFWDLAIRWLKRQGVKGPSRKFLQSKARGDILHCFWRVSCWYKLMYYNTEGNVVLLRSASSHLLVRQKQNDWFVIKSWIDVTSFMKPKFSYYVCWYWFVRSYLFTLSCFKINRVLRKTLLQYSVFSSQHKLEGILGTFCAALTALANHVLMAQMGSVDNV